MDMAEIPFWHEEAGFLQVRHFRNPVYVVFLEVKWGSASRFDVFQHVFLA